VREAGEAATVADGGFDEDADDEQETYNGPTQLKLPLGKQLEKPGSDSGQIIAGHNAPARRRMALDPRTLTAEEVAAAAAKELYAEDAPDADAIEIGDGGRGHAFLPHHMVRA